MVDHQRVAASLAHRTQRRDVAEVIIAAAVLGRQFDWTLLPGLTGATESAVLTTLRQARAMQLIEPTSSDAVTFRFRHSLTRHAILSDLLPPDLARRSANSAARSVSRC